MTAVIRFPPNQHFDMKPHVVKFATALEEFMGGAMNFGTYEDHSPPEGPTQAIDIFNPNSRSGWAEQDEICNWILADDFKIGYLYGVRYFIRRHQIWNIERADEGWRDQGVTGDQTKDHMDHTHVTFYADAPINHETPTKEGRGMKVRYIWGPDGLSRTDWVFDGPSRIFATGMTATVLAACDKSGIVELGNVDDQTHNWYKNVASGWK